EYALLPAQPPHKSDRSPGPRPRFWRRIPECRQVRAVGDQCQAATRHTPAPECPLDRLRYGDDFRKIACGEFVGDAIEPQRRAELVVIDTHVPRADHTSSQPGRGGEAEQVGLIPVGVADIDPFVPHVCANQPERGEIEPSAAREYLHLYAFASQGLRQLEMRMPRVQENADPGVAAEPLETHREVPYNCFGAVRTSAADQLECLHGRDHARSWPGSAGAEPKWRQSLWYRCSPSVRLRTPVI